MRALALLPLMLAAMAPHVAAYATGYREKTIESGQINVYGLDAGSCSVSYNLVCKVPCYGSVMSINQMQSFTDGLFKPLTGILCTNNGRARPGAITNCSDTVPLNYGDNCGNFQGYQLAVYFNVSNPDGSMVDTDYTLQWTSTGAPAPPCHCPRPSLHSVGVPNQCLPQPLCNKLVAVTQVGGCNLVIIKLPPEPAAPPLERPPRRCPLQCLQPAHAPVCLRL